MAHIASSDLGALVESAILSALATGEYFPGLVAGIVRKHWSDLASSDQIALMSLIEGELRTRPPSEPHDLTWKALHQWMKAHARDPEASA